MKKLLLPLLPLLCLALTTGAPAQNARVVMFRTICLEQTGGIQEAAVPSVKDPDTMVKVPLYTSDFSEVVEARFSGSEAVFYAASPGADGKPVPVARGPLAKASRQVFVFLPSGGDKQPPYRVISYDDDTAAFALGSIRAVNLSPVPVRFVVSGAVSPQIPPTKHALFPQPKKINDYNMYPVVIEFLGGDGKWVKGQSTSWKANDRKRETVFTLINSKYKQPEVKVYTDFPPWLEAPQP